MRWIDLSPQDGNQTLLKSDCVFCNKSGYDSNFYKDLCENHRKKLLWG